MKKSDEFNSPIFAQAVAEPVPSQPESPAREVNFSAVRPPMYRMVKSGKIEMLDISAHSPRGGL